MVKFKTLLLNGKFQFCNIHIIINLFVKIISNLKTLLNIIIIFIKFIFNENLYNSSLGPLVNKVKENQVETIVDALCTNMISENEQLRDICSIGLKTVISDLPITNTPLAANVCRRITGKLTSAIEKVILFFFYH